MTLTAASLLGTGTSLSIGTIGGSPTFVAIAKLKKVSPPQSKWGTEDITTLDSGLYRTFTKTLADAGEISIEGLNTSGDPGQIALNAAAQASPNQTGGSAYPFKLALPIDGAAGQTTTGDTFTFNAHVIEFSVQDAEADKTVMFKSTLKITGAVTFTEGA